MHKQPFDLSSEVYGTHKKKCWLFKKMDKHTEAVATGLVTLIIVVALLLTLV